MADRKKSNVGGLVGDKTKPEAKRFLLFIHVRQSHRQLLFITIPIDRDFQ